MYVSPNGMVFDSFKDSMIYCKEQLRKKQEEFYIKSGFKEAKCPACGQNCDTKKSEKLYICMRCGVFKLEDEDESED